MSHTPRTIKTTSDKSFEFKLEQNHWCPAVKAELEKLIYENADKGKKVIFDFDNTLICRDIGEATFAVIVADKRLTSTNIPREISPSFMIQDRLVSLETVEDISVYYEELLDATIHQVNEITPYSNGYAWLVQIMTGITPAEIIYYTNRAFAEGKAEQDANDPNLNETKIHGYHQPFFYREMVDLAGVCLKNGFDIYIVSASNVWSVRWMVLNNLNKLIQSKFGEEFGIPANHVIGLSVLLKDKRSGYLYKDLLLVNENRNYANLNSDELANYELTTQIVYPLPAYFGKVPNIYQYVTLTRPFLIAGDSPSDHPMLNWAENRLWLARLEKMEYQQQTVRMIKNSLPGQWLLQPVLHKKSPGFVSSYAEINQRDASIKDLVESVMQLFKKEGQLQYF